MTLFFWLLLAAAWWRIGYRSFVYWWTTEYDFDTDDRVVALVTGLCGPLNYFIGRSVMNSSEPRVIVPKRGHR